MSNSFDLDGDLGALAKKRAMVLLVDDQALVGESLRRQFAHQPDIDFHFCADAAAALGQARRIQPTVILQDLVMPGVDGLDLVRQYRADPILKDVPVLVLSVREEPETKGSAFAAGANDYLVKLPSPVEMQARIRYHSAAYLAQKDRDEAMRALRESQRELLDSNTALISLNQKLEVATRAKSEFLAMMSHEIRTPLSGVLGFSDLLAESALTEDQRGYVETIRSSGRALLTVINDILDFSKIEAGKLSIENENFELARCIQESCELFLPNARDHATSLEWEVAADVPGWVEGDSMRLRQVISNLVSNAVKFTRSGSIEVLAERGDPLELSRVSGRFFPPAEEGSFYLRMSVTDTGVGVPEDKAGQLFRTFDQLDPSTARKFGGSGLGLTICRRLCQLMGGEIWLAERKSVGSEFVFMVKLQEGCIPEGGVRDLISRPDVEVAKCLAKTKVVVAEDNKANAALMAAMLRKFGVSARMVTNGAMALETVVEDGANLVFMDVQMPELDGLEATRAIRAREREAQLPPCHIIALTAEAMQGDAERCFAAGMNDYLAKPLKVSELAAALARYCSSRPSLPS